MFIRSFNGYNTTSYNNFSRPTSCENNVLVEWSVPTMCAKSASIGANIFTKTQLQCTCCTITTWGGVLDWSTIEVKCSSFATTWKW